MFPKWATVVSFKDNSSSTSIFFFPALPLKWYSPNYPSLKNNKTPCILIFNIFLNWMFQKIFLDIRNIFRNTIQNIKKKFWEGIFRPELLFRTLVLYKFLYSENLNLEYKQISKTKIVEVTFVYGNTSIFQNDFQNTENFCYIFNII